MASFYWPLETFIENWSLVYLFAILLVCIVSFADGTKTKNDADKKMVSDVEEVCGKLQKL